MLLKHTRNLFTFSPDDSGDAGMDADDQSVVTAEEQSPESSDGNIVFTQDEANLEVPTQVKEEIKRHVSLIVEQHNLLLNALQTAVNMFDTAMHFASESEAAPDISGVLLKTAFDFGVSKLSEHIPGLSTAKSFLDATTAELERAGQARQSFEVGQWINIQRAIIGNQLITENNQDKRDLLQADTESDYLEQNEQGQGQQFLDQLHQANVGLAGPANYTQEDLAARLFEQWINAHFISLAQDALGCIEYELNYEDEKYDFRACRVQAPFGDKIEGALNQLLDSGRLSGISQPIGFKVRKRVCMGAGPWDCSGWLDQDNNVMDEPGAQTDREGFRSEYWRTTISHFFH